MIRVVVVDDSPTARALLVEVLRGDPEIQVVGEAKDGLEGVDLTQKLKPNVVTMDIQMPRMDGFAATKEIMITAPTPIVVATSSAKASEVAVAMQALQARGAGLRRGGPEAPLDRQGHGPPQGGEALAARPQDRGTSPRAAPPG